MSSDLLWGNERLGVGFWQVSLESGLSDEVLDTRLGKRVSKKGFREEDDKLIVS
jgi:hypothetical protein